MLAVTVPRSPHRVVRSYERRRRKFARGERGRERGGNAGRARHSAGERGKSEEGDNAARTSPERPAAVPSNSDRAAPERTTEAHTAATFQAAASSSNVAHQQSNHIYSHTARRVAYNRKKGKVLTWSAQALWGSTLGSGLGRASDLGQSRPFFLLCATRSHSSTGIREQWQGATCHACASAKG